MFRELIRMWKRIDLLQEALRDFLTMIDDVEQMFGYASDALFQKRATHEAAEIIYRTDVKVNQTERTIRKRLVEHLAVNPRADAPACLILMSVSKDVERAGDYCKNLLEVAEMLKEPVDNLKYANDLRDLAQEVRTAFAKTRKAFADTDPLVGHEVIVEERRISRRSDELVEQVAGDASLNSNQAVCLALGFRFLKRVNAHLGNVASSVVMPLHKIDYFDEKYTPRDEKKAMDAKDSNQ